MKILAVGDLVGKSGYNKMKEILPNIIKENNIDFIIVNGEKIDLTQVGTEELFLNLMREKIDAVLAEKGVKKTGTTEKDNTEESSTKEPTAETNE